MSIDVYNLGAMRKAITFSGTGATSGEMEHATDLNLLTACEMVTAPGFQYIYVDLGSAQDITAVAVAFKNYLSDWTAYGSYAVGYSSDNITYTSIVSQGFSVVLSGAIGHPIWFPVDGGTTYSYRYWRFGVSSVGSSVHVSQIMLGKKETIATGKMFPTTDAVQYYNKIVTALSGHPLVDPLKLYPVEEGSRSYLIEASRDDWPTLLALYDACRGTRYPFILQEGTAESDARLMSFSQDSLSRSLITAGLKSTAFEVREEIYHRDGEDF